MKYVIKNGIYNVSMYYKDLELNDALNLNEQIPTDLTEVFMKFKVADSKVINVVFLGQNKRLDSTAVFYDTGLSIKEMLEYNNIYSYKRNIYYDYELTNLLGGLDAVLNINQDFDTIYVNADIYKVFRFVNEEYNVEFISLGISYDYRESAKDYVINKRKLDGFYFIDSSGYETIDLDVSQLEFGSTITIYIIDNN